MASDDPAPAHGVALGAPAAARQPIGFMALLTAMTALAPLSLQIFVPALPAIQATYGVAAGTAQLALSLRSWPTPSRRSAMGRSRTASGGGR